jgi:hypothetical protein
VQTNREEWQTTGTTGFQGNISHHGAGKPFKDGFVNKAGVAAAAKADAEQEVSHRSLDVPEHGVGACMEGPTSALNALVLYCVEDTC